MDKMDHTLLLPLPYLYSFRLHDMYTSDILTGISMLIDVLICVPA